MKRILKALYFSPLFFYLTGGLVILFVLSYFMAWVFPVAKIAFIGLISLLVTDFLLLFASGQKFPQGIRDCPERLSNGDENTITLRFTHYYPFKSHIQLIDELPPQFQIRDFVIKSNLPAGKTGIYSYTLRPVKRGEYAFGALNVFAESPLRLVRRRFRFKLHRQVPVYPSFLQMRKYELMAASNFLTEAGIKKIRRISHSHEFDQIRNYVKGDEYRNINWKATARKAQLMVNEYQAEKSQAVYSLIDMGRNMAMPFEGMYLLDYAINATLVISNIAMYKQDRAGMVAFNNKIRQELPANRSSKHMQLFMEHLYKLHTQFPEANYELLYSYIRRHVRQRSLLILYTNFQGISSVKRQLGYLRMLSQKHLLVVVFFENTQINGLLEKPAQNTREIYEKTIAEQFRYEKKMIVKELQRYSIHALFVPPAQLTVATINKYLEIKSMGLL